MHYLLYAICAGLVVFGLVNIADVQIPVVNTSASTNHPNLSWTETFPPRNSTAGIVSGGTNHTILFQVNLSANQTIAEGTPVTMTVGGSEDLYFFDNASSIFVGFAGAVDTHSFVNVGPSGTGFAGVSLFPGNKPTKGTNLGLQTGTWLVGNVATIEWPSQGDKPLSIVIALTNATTISYTYKGDIVHVSSPGAARGSQVLLATASLAVGAFLFAIFDVVSRVRKGRQRSALKGSRTRPRR